MMTVHTHTHRGLPVGRGVPAAPSMGFARPVSRTGSDALYHAGDGHLITLAPTGAGKGRSGVIPALLTHPGSTLTIDIKGENYHVTARRRREMGHRVVVLDPFRAAVPNPDTLNPLDLLSLDGAEPDSDSELLAELMCGGQPISTKDLFWELTGKGMITGLVGYAGEHPDPAKRTLANVLDMMYADDTDYNIAVVLDTFKFTNETARQELVGYLQHEKDKCRPSVRSTAQSMVKCLGSKSVRAALEKTSFDLAAWCRGDPPVDIYLIFPPEKLDSHRAVLRLLLGTLLTVLLRRKTPPSERTLLLLDECGQLGALSHLKTALTLLRGYGVQAWTFWQDLSQLRALYPTDWETVLNNSAVVQAFGMTNGWMARTTAELMGLPVNHLLRMAPDEQILSRPGKGAELVRRVDYLTDPQFAGLFDPNPRYLGGPSR